MPSIKKRRVHSGHARIAPCLTHKAPHMFRPGLFCVVLTFGRIFAVHARALRALNATQSLDACTFPESKLYRVRIDGKDYCRSTSRSILLCAFTRVSWEIEWASFFTRGISCKGANDDLAHAHSSRALQSRGGELKIRSFNGLSTPYGRFL